MLGPDRQKRSPKPAPGSEPNFLLRFLDDPRRTGAVAPSGPFLAREMARAVDPSQPGLIAELGPGTGPVTKALLARGILRERLVLVEFDPQFCTSLSSRFPQVRVLRGDAYALRRTLEGLGQPIAAVVSSLPLLNEPPVRRLKLLEEAFSLMGPGGVFVQFTYGLSAPVSREACAGRYVAARGAPIWRNLPPACVWTYALAAEARPAKVMRLIDRAERLGARIRATETMIGRQSDKMIDRLKREVAALKRTPRRKD